MPTTVLYRLSSNQVMKISLKGQPFADRNTNYWGVLTDPPLPDGTENRETINGRLGPLGVLGFQKIVDSGTVRNATQLEIDGFAAYATDDDNQQMADRAVELLSNHPQFRKLLTAYSDILKDEFNALRGWLRDFKVVVDSASNLNDIKVGVAALPNLLDRDLSQLKTAIVNRISKDD